MAMAFTAPQQNINARKTARRASRSVEVYATAKRVVITGGNTGIGYESAKTLCQKGYDVTIACRDVNKAQGAIQKLKEAVPSASVDSITLDLANLASVRDCANSLLDSSRHIDVLLNNAGVMACPKMATTDGFEYQLGVNHLGHFLLTTMLLPRLQSSASPVRVINVASAAHLFGKIDFNDLMRDKSYDAWDAYGQSKLANVLFTYEMAKRLAGNPQNRQITVNALHPGVVKTELGRYMVNDQNSWFMGPAVAAASLFFKTPQQGAETSIYLASSPEVEGVTSKYFVDCRPQVSSPASYDPDTASKLWDVSCELVAAKVPLTA